MLHDVKKRLCVCQPMAPGRHKDRLYGSTSQLRMEACSGGLENIRGLPIRRAYCAGDVARQRTLPFRSRYSENSDEYPYFLLRESV